MKFTKLRILGFKSFVEPVEFPVERGLTGVVGPNGCGKSNLVEAIKWAMGESSYKNMRASGMDDVIFSGSASRPARNTAEVTLVIDNVERTAPAAFNDSDTIEVTRRIERESGSIYRINGKEARAKDVQLLFADASTGARSPAMVGQGRIGELISAKPAQRRQLLEEAAGISGLHSRRHEAELRLRATEQNLDRVEDVVAQMENQLEGLRRQARQAARYRALSSEIRKFDALIHHLRWIAAGSALREAEEAFSGFGTAVAEAAALQAETARNQAVTANALPALRERAAAAAAALQRLRHEQGALEKEETQAAARLNELSARMEQLDHDIARENAFLGENKDVFERIAREEKELEHENAASDAQRHEAQARLEAARAKQEESEAAFNTLTREVAELNAQRKSLEANLQNARNQIARLASDTAKIEREIAEIDAKMTQDLFINAQRKALDDARAAVLKSETESEAAERETHTLREAENAARLLATSLEKELGALETEARTLSGILNAHKDDGLPRLIDGLRAEPGYEAALGAALGEDLDAATDERAAVHWAGAAVAHDDPALPDGVRALSDFVSAPALVKRRLLQIGVAEAAEAAALARALKPGQRLVSRDGGLWRWDGLVAKAGAETPAAQRLAQKNRLTALETAAAQKRAQTAAQKEKLSQAGSALQAAIRFEREARDRLRAHMAEASKAQDLLAKTENEASRLTERRALSAERKARLEVESAAAATQADKHAASLAGAPETAVLTERLETAQKSLSAERTALAEARAGFETLTREAEMRTRRLRAIAEERASWLARSQAAEKQIAILSSRREETAAERAGLADAPAEFSRKRAALFGEIEKAEKDRGESHDRLAETEQVLRQADRAATEALDALSKIREARARAEERVESAKARKQDMARQIAENLECAPAALPGLAELAAGAPLPEAAGVETRLERLKAERERLGGVNLRAEQEIREIGEKRDLLQSERDDLIEAIRQLRLAIGNLNKEGRERLLAAFDEVNGHFKRLFTHLFGGGTAELQLTESDDPLEAGLDIVARPPGKKPQTMTLLSGGEQALTAMALIFAVFLTNPAPICVLDEVDAPLDDANVERFCNLLDDMIRTTETRFLTITHNPITMARMNRLFGVTMAERGVSQLVSVDLETAERFREAG